MQKDVIIRQIQAMQQRTVLNGCTEAEAMTAAKLMAKLMAQYGLAMTDLEIEQQECEQGDIETGRKRAHEIGYCIRAIGNFTDCRVWQTRKPSFTYSFFGFPEDVKNAHYLYQTIMMAMINASICYKHEAYRDGQKISAAQSHSFLLGMAKRICQRLKEIKRAQQTETFTTSGRDLVVVKSRVVEQNFAKLGLRLNRGLGGSGSKDSSAFAAGQRAGDGVGFHSGVSQQRAIEG